MRAAWISSLAPEFAVDGRGRRTGWRRPPTRGVDTRMRCGEDQRSRTSRARSRPAPPGVAAATPLTVISGLTSVPIDATTNLVAEPGMQLVIIDFAVPGSAPVGTYTLKLQFSGTRGRRSGTAKLVRNGNAGTRSAEQRRLDSLRR